MASVSGHPKPARAPIEEEGASGGSPSQCELHRAFIEQRLEKGLSATQIHQDLCEMIDGRPPSYYRVRRFVAKLQAKQPIPFQQMKVKPGDEAQADFGTGAPIIDGIDKRRRPWVCRVVLRNSRKRTNNVMWV